MEADGVHGESDQEGGGHGACRAAACGEIGGAPCGGKPWPCGKDDRQCDLKAEGGGNPEEGDEQEGGMPPETIARRHVFEDQLRIEADLDFDESRFVWHGLHGWHTYYNIIVAVAAAVVV